jgi:hypothetical protein
MSGLSSLSKGKSAFLIAGVNVGNSWLAATPAGLETHRTPDLEIGATHTWRAVRNAGQGPGTLILGCRHFYFG